MEFNCVFSVGGSLASYLVKKENETTYSARLRSSHGKRDDLPDEVLLEKIEDKWNAQPWHEDVVNGITQAIDGNR